MHISLTGYAEIQKRSKNNKIIVSQGINHPVLSFGFFFLIGLCEMTGKRMNKDSKDRKKCLRGPCLLAEGWVELGGAGVEALSAS